MELFCHTLLTMTAAASIAALGVMLVRLFLKKTPRWITCTLWLIVFLRMICPVSFSLPVSLMPQAVSDGAVAQRVLPVSPLDLPDQETTESPAAPVSDTAAAPAVPQAAPAESTVPSWSVAVFSIWAAGTAGMVVWAAVSYGNLRRRMADAVRIEDNIYETDQTNTPFVCGFRKPRIYLPAGMDAADRRYVLLHEQAHIKRFDYRTKPLAYFALCIHWFNPILWFSYRLFCRDVETACDQAVTRAFDRQDTAGYAAALLHLGRKSTLPSAVPLAFGEDDAKGRVKGVLNYQKPSFWITLTAVCACAVVAVLLLANPGDRGPQLEGVSITQVQVVDHSLPVDLPEDLSRELIALLKEYKHEDYTALESFSPTEGCLILSSRKDGTTFYLTEQPTGVPTFIRVNHDGYSATRKQAPTAGLAQAQEYTDWKAAVEKYLTEGRADEIYAMKNPYIGDHVADMEILGALGVGQAAGPFTIELQTSEKPYGITVHLEQAMPFQSGDFTRYITTASQLFLALVDNAQSVSWKYNSQTHTIFAEEPTKTLSQADFQKLCQELWEYGGDYRTYVENSTYVPSKALYVSPDLAPGIDVPEDGPGSSTFTIRPDVFSAQVVNRLLSSYPAPEEVIENPIYDNGGSGPSVDQMNLPDDVAAQLHGPLWDTVCTVLDAEHQDTGYRIIATLSVPDDSLEHAKTTWYIAHVTFSGETYDWVTDYLFELQPAV